MKRTLLYDCSYGLKRTFLKTYKLSHMFLKLLRLITNMINIVNKAISGLNERIILENDELL
jgi:hypothetical protein